MHGGTALLPSCISVDVNKRGKKWERPESKDRSDYFTSKDGNWYLLCQRGCVKCLSILTMVFAMYLLSQRA